MTSSTPFPTVPICGIPVLALSPAEALEELVRRVETGEGARVVTLNVEMIARALRDSQYADWLLTADLVIPDGMPVVWAMRKKLKGQKKLTRVTGVDITHKLLRKVSPEDIAIVGGQQPMLALERVGVEKPESVYINSEKLEASQDQFELLAPHLKGRNLIFLALGVPKQDAFAVAFRELVPHAVLIPNGGTFELLAGLMPRAPRWMQLSGLEWLFRLAVEPRRLWRRYLVEYWSGVFCLLRNQSIRPGHS